MDFKALVTAQLNANNVESELKDLCKDRDINLKVNLIGNVDVLKNIQKQFSGIENVVTKAGKIAGKSYATSLQKQIEAVAKTQRNSFSQPLYNRTKQELDYSDWFNKQLEKQSKNTDNIFKRYQERFSSLQGKDVSKFVNTAGYTQLETNLKEISILQDRVSKGLEKDPDIDKINSDLKEMNSLLSKSETLYSNLSKPIGTLDATTASNKTLSWLKNNTKATKELGNAFESLAKKQSIATTKGELENYSKEFTSLVATAQAKGLTGASLLEDSKRAFSQIAQFTGMYSITQNLFEEIPRQMLTYVADVDNAMTNLQMATGVTDTEAKELMKTYSAMGKELKTLGTDVSASSTEWLKQGKSIQEANKLTKDSIILSKIGDMSSEDATKTITAAMKSYDLVENEVMEFIDQISAIDMASATDVAGLSDAFNEVAANAKVAGVETENLLSYLAVIGETSQDGMSSVGTSVNAIFSRMGNIKLSRLKDYENGGEDLSNVETVLKKNGIALRDAAGQFREFDDVLAETANKWKEFDSVTRRAVGNAFAGTHHQNSFTILMENWGNVEKYITTATTSSGESMKKFEEYQDSLAGSVEGFKNAAQSLSNTTIDSGFLTGAVNIGTTFLEILEKIIDNFGTVQTIIGGFAIGKGIKSFAKGFDKPTLVS